MALKFLNKKGWHTGSLRNIENVWKAEQKRDAEDKKLDELRKQIVEERERSEFRLLQVQAGLVPKQERLEFLYDSGLSVGRPGGSDAFNLPKPEEPPSSSTAAPAPAKQQPTAPGALFEEKPQSANDAWRKLHSDPLLMIRQREQEALSRIKNNPVQMAMIRKSVDAKKPSEKEDDKKEPRKKRHHTSKHRKHSSSKQASDSENETVEVERRKSSHHKISKYANNSDSEDGSRKIVRRSEKHAKHSDSEDESRDRGRRNEKNPVRHSDSADESRYRAWRSEKNHVKHLVAEDESHYRAGRSEKHPVRHSDFEHESHYRAHRSEKKRVNHSDSEDESLYKTRRSEKNHVKNSDSEDESGRRARRSEKNHVKHSDFEDVSRDRAHRGEKNHSIKVAREDGQGVVKGKNDSSDVEKYSVKGRNESQYKRRNGAPKLSEEERAARLREMQMDAELHEEQRWKRLKKAAENDAQEATRAVNAGGRNFLDAVQTSVYGAEKGGSSTIEESVRRRTHYLQGRPEASERNAFRR
ncbi:uncharacterized protein [Malus domestica]|uniref:uncharacterized protein isoform X2 n=1 Tax=Malus domestica TaxID=3750 RepID=UPI000498F8CE